MISEARAILHEKGDVSLNFRSSKIAGVDLCLPIISQIEVPALDTNIPPQMTSKLVEVHTSIYLDKEDIDILIKALQNPTIL
jgi:hypothetical protein